MYSSSNTADLRSRHATSLGAVHQRTDRKTTSPLLVSLHPNLQIFSKVSGSCIQTPWYSGNHATIVIATAQAVLHVMDCDCSLPLEAGQPLLWPQQMTSWAQHVVSDDRTHLSEELLFQLEGPAPMCLCRCCQVTKVCTLQHHLHGSASTNGWWHQCTL